MIGMKNRPTIDKRITQHYVVIDKRVNLVISSVV